MRIIAIALSLLAGVAAAQEPFVCASSPKNDQRVEEMAAWLAARDEHRASKGLLPAGEAYAKNNVVVMTADDTTAPFRQPIDIAGESLTFTRASGDSFSETTTAANYETAIGTLITADTASRIADYTIAGFDFPFLGRNIRTLHVSQLHAIYLDTPPAVPSTSFTQYNDAELLAPAQGVIAPLLTTPNGLASGRPSIFVKENSDRVVVTWSLAATNEAIQAVLFKNGDIRFTYLNIGATRVGNIVITSGSESWRESLLIAAGSDAPNDVPTTFSSSVAPMLDITSATLNRVGNTNLLRLVIKLAGPFNRSVIGTNNYATYNASIVSGAAFQNVTAYFSGSGSGSDQMYVPGWGYAEPSPAMHVEGDIITLTFAQEMWLTAGTADADVQVATYINHAADTMTFHAKIVAPSRQVRTDFGNASSIAATSGPIVESFTLPVLSPSSVWNRITSSFKFDSNQIDGVAIYQNFFTDIILYAGAYSTGGNPAVDNIATGTRSSTTKFRAPALCHMNAIRYNRNGAENTSAFLLMHEFGHRWLHLINIFDPSGLKTNVLNPLTAHPAQYVDTRAAFPVHTAADSSVMGGSTFTDNQNGTFSTPEADFAWGYSWLDLYLMGLADPSEVPPFFYLTNSQPALGQEYNPPAHQMYTAMRNDITIDNVTHAMGLRSPAYPNTQRQFRLIFVLLTDPTRSVTDDDINEVAKYAQAFSGAFATATGKRASIVSDFSAKTSSHRRAAHH